MLYRILFKNNSKKIELESVSKITYSQSELWKYGVSGDLPIILGIIKDVSDSYVIEDLIKAHEFFSNQNIKTELVIIIEEENIYEQYIKEQIENIILNKNIVYLKDVPGGIFVLNSNEISKETQELFIFVSSIYINAKNGSIKNSLEDVEEEYLDTIKNIGNDKTNLEVNFSETNNEQRLNTIIDDLKYYNEYGGFSNDGREYLIKINKENKLPTTWSHCLANEKFGTIVTESMGGYTWSKNSRLNRLTAWNNSSSIDLPSEIIYIKDRQTGKSWSVGASPMADDNDYYVAYGFGYARYTHLSNGVIQELTTFVPEKDSSKVNIINFRNVDSCKKELKLIYYIKPVLAEDEIKSNSYINLEKNGDIITAQNLYNTDFKDSIMYVCSSEKIESYTGDKSSFLGKGTLENPEGINKVELSNENSLGVDSCIAIELNVSLEGFESKNIVVILGEENNILDIKNMAYKYSNISNCKEELKNVIRYWDEIINRVQVKTPIESINIMLNGWAIYQTLACRVWSRSGYYQSGGAFGFRDQLQDTLGLKYVDSKFMKRQILKASSHQFIEGDVEHWWHEETNKGIRTRFSDDLLWLVYVVCEYIILTNDYTLLDIEVPYINGELLEENEDEKYDLHLESDIKENIFKHCTRAIEKSFNFGENGLPKIGSGDWNDGFSTVGNKGQGTSVWLGFFMVDVLQKWIEICKNKTQEVNEKEIEEINEQVKKYEETAQRLRRALNTARMGWKMV